MNRHDVMLLQQIKQYPCVTITLPTHRTRPDNQQDAIRLNNLVSEASSRLLAEFSKREVANILARLEETANSVSHQQNLDGLVLFVNEDMGLAHKLPFTVPERVIIDETFATRKLVLALNRTVRYWVLALSENETRLFEATRDTLIEVESEEFPMKHDGPGGKMALPSGPKNVSAYRDEYHRQFFRRVDEQLGLFLTDDPLPVFVLGVDRYLAFFDEVTDHKDKVLGTVQGNYDKHTVSELADVVWPVAKEALLAEHMKVMDLLNTAVNERRVATALDNVWRAAQEGRGRILIVEENYHFPALLDETGWHLTVADSADDPEAIEDAVDEIIEAILAKGGEVFFVPDGSLSDYQRMALLLRY